MTGVQTCALPISGATAGADGALVVVDPAVGLALVFFFVAASNGLAERARPSTEITIADFILGMSSPLQQSRALGLAGRRTLGSNHDRNLATLDLAEAPQRTSRINCGKAVTELFASP